MSWSREIGGYLQLELGDGQIPYPHAYPVNCGRAGLEVILKRRGYRRIWVPAYICNAVYETVEKTDVEAVSYGLTRNLEPRNIPRLSREDALLYVNYWGLKDKACDALSSRVGNLILDLSQALFYKPRTNVDAFNSIRKFVGVPDGGYLFGGCVEGLDLPRAMSWQHCEHLLRRSDGDVSGGYAAFKAIEDAISHWNPMRMSLLTERMVRALDFGAVKRRRRANYQYLHKTLKKKNELLIAQCGTSVPLCYPYFIRRGSVLKQRLNQRRIYTPSYWPDIDERISGLETEIDIKNNLVCLPIDQRYGADEMDALRDALREESLS